MKKRRVIICGAGGRDFFDFLVCFKDNPAYDVVCFTAAQIPGIEKRTFPKELAGRLYKKNIPIYPEEQLQQLIKKYDVDEVVLAYSDVSHLDVMRKASIILAHGASFRLLGPKDTMLMSKKPVIAICAVRTGAGKSQTARRVADILKAQGLKVVTLRHPMPYGILMKQVVERFTSYDDLKKYNTTIEEREEYEPWIQRSIPVYAGVDYAQILKQAEKEADIIIWDAGNNDFSFVKPDLLIVVADPLRPGHEQLYYPGETNVRMADVIVINKVNSAQKQQVNTVIRNIKALNPRATMIKAASQIIVDQPSLITHKRVLLVEDGPTLTHGGMRFGAATVAAQRYHAKEIVSVKPYAVGSIKKTFEEYKHLKHELPAMGYSKQQIKDLQKTINRVPCDVVIDGSPVNLKKLMKVNKPIVNVTYELEEIGRPTLEDILKKFIRKNAA